ncbi:hypothetical protein PQR34_47445 [Paraburkholderia sediminicola]|uniref:hypothetical protein n=1 Tax=Paraburkholderia sediminicola TaxID=458836 RepID=UPI0038B9AF9A
MSGVSWRTLAQIALKGDFKNRKIGGLLQKGVMEQTRQGLTLDQLVAMEQDNDGSRY